MFSPDSSCRRYEVGLTLDRRECYVVRMVDSDGRWHAAQAGEDASRAQSISKWSGVAREQAVQGMFTAIARFYDLNNSLLSVGQHRRWKRIAAGLVPVMEEGCAIDIGAGTGDLAILLAKRFGKKGHVLAADLNAAMLKEGQKKIARRGLQDRITSVRLNAERLACRSDSCDAATAGFCVRNVGDLMKAFGEIYRVLKPGGCFVCLEFSRPVRGWLRGLYDWYSFRLLPRIGTVVAQDTTGVYEYLPASIRTFPDQDGLVGLLLKAGFREATYQNLSGGIVAIHVAIK
jgi:demethylmenaquinone methyltransferase/2-methoxy-6-polyprenyl-1,4-benzoquinol methylase